MKVHKVEVWIADDHGIGSDKIKDAIENAIYQNVHISPEVKRIDTIERKVLVVEDKIIDEFGNRECAKCGRHYGKACQNCCEHQIELEDEYDRGVIISCPKCLKEFSIAEFMDNFVILAADDKRLQDRESQGMSALQQSTEALRRMS